MLRLLIRTKRFFSFLKPGRRSLKETLAIYFVPITVLPAIFISIYATQLLESSTRESLNQKARTERKALIAEMLSFEKSLLTDAKRHARQRSLTRALQMQSAPQIRKAVRSYRKHLQVRLFTLRGKFVANRSSSDEQVPYISKSGLARVKKIGLTIDRYFSDKGIKTIIRVLVRDSYNLYGVLEEEYVFSHRDLLRLKDKRQVDLVLLNKDLNAVTASFALSQEAIKSISKAAFTSTFQAAQEPVLVRLGDNRFAAFLYHLGFPSTKKGWGFFAVFLPMAATDSIIGKLKLAMVYMTATLILIAALLIFVFSRRLVSPIEKLVYAMKRTKSGRAEQIPEVDSTYEIEYLVRSFNEMSKNISAAKQTLELKLTELRKANQEIKDTQGHLIQSAKMISLGQLVAGVAHELNNPIAFIYSNMLHLTEYVRKLKVMIDEYKRLHKMLPESERKKVEALERDLEIDYILEDMVDLTRSCVDGANRTKDIVLGLRTFSRMDESTFQKVDLREGLRNTVKLLVTEFKDRVTVHEEFTDISLVECNLSQMNQVFMNLISNAAQAIKNRGDIWIRTFQHKYGVEIEIEDNGSGIPPDVVEKIFDPFFTTKKIGKGTGLGLSIAYGLIQKHNGKIEVDSQVGRGTKFTIQLPFDQKTETQSA